MARLRIVSGEGVEQVLEVREQRLQIGRGRDNDVVLPDPEKGVSRTHAELRLENDRYVIVDLQSQNGTWVNGARVDRAEVPYGAEIAVGGYRLTLAADGAAARSAAGSYSARGSDRRHAGDRPARAAGLFSEPGVQAAREAPAGRRRGRWGWRLRSW